jgi:hypothetical protein
MTYGTKAKLIGKERQYKKYNVVDCPNDNTKCIIVKV